MSPRESTASPCGDMNWPGSSPAGRWTMHVVPLGLILAVAVEHLDAMVLAVGDIHPAVGVAADVVGNVELARVGAGSSPRAKQGAVGRVLVDARVPVAVRDIEIALRRQRG